MSKKRKQSSHLARNNSDKTCIPIDEQGLETLEAIVEAYISEYRPRAQEEQRFYALQKRRGKLIDYAGMARTFEGKRHPHQRRITKLALQESTSRLELVNFADSRNFDELLSLVEGAIAEIPGIGELTVYDTATRIAAGFEFEPNRVYLHAGTRSGAKALKLGRGRRYIELAELPIAFQRLKAREIEDCLCIYKADLHRLAKSTSYTL